MAVVGDTATWATAHQCAVKLPRDPILHSVRLAQWKDEVLQVLLYALADFQSREQALLGVSRVANSVMGTEAKRKAVSSFLAVVQGNEHWFADATKLEEFCAISRAHREWLEFATVLLDAERPLKRVRSV